MVGTPLILIIVDGFGIPSPLESDSVVYHSTIPTLQALIAQKNTVRLSCSGLAVGLPEGYMGNSEVGHLTIGSGRVINQSFVAIENSIKDGSFFEFPALIDAIQKTKKQGGRLHCMGLLSKSGVHAHLSHFLASIELSRRYDIELIFHLFTDGRDAGAFDGVSLLKELQEAITVDDKVKLGGIVGRYFAMDRDQRWDRTEKAYRHLVCDCEDYVDVISYMEGMYSRGITDEFIEPVCLCPSSRIQNNDSVFFLNFRADRARQLTHALLGTAPFSPQYQKLALTSCISMTRYANELATTVLFEKERPCNTLGTVLSAHGLRQLRIAETEKYAHVTYFFNGGAEEKTIGEEHCLIPSPQDVPTYDCKPEMSAYEMTDYICDALSNNMYDVYICNFANPDMVGHTGNPEASIKALETVDSCIRKILEQVQAHNGNCIITADHGNIEGILRSGNILHTAHTCNDVYCMFVLESSLSSNTVSHNGALRDIAPTMLYILGIDKPVEMSGSSLLSKKGDK